MPAASYLVTDVGSSELVDTIRSVHAGRTVINPDIASRLAAHVANEMLTPRQHEALECLAKGKSNQEVAETLFITEDTVNGTPHTAHPVHRAPPISLPPSRKSGRASPSRSS